MDGYGTKKSGRRITTRDAQQNEWGPKTQSLDCAGPKTQSQRDWVFERLGFWTGAQAEELGFWTGAHCISDHNLTVDEILRGTGFLSDWVFERLGF